MSLNTSVSPFSTPSRYSPWQLIVLLALVFWLSSSVFLDFVIMPIMYATGMMASSSFATAGYSIFWIFNRVEILCAAIILTSILGWVQQAHLGLLGRKAIALATSMMAIALVATYFLTPEMSALSLDLSAFEPAATVPAAMNWLHGEYFGMELVKGLLGIVLLALSLRQDDMTQEA